MAKNRNTFAKHQRDVEKKARAEAKQVRRNDRREARKAAASSEGAPDETGEMPLPEDGPAAAE